MEIKVKKIFESEEKKMTVDGFSLGLDSSSSSISKSKSTWTATLGLVVHAAADGIALGAASATSRFNVEMIVFMAIMLHKVSTELSYY